MRIPPRPCAVNVLAAFAMAAITALASAAHAQTPAFRTLHRFAGDGESNHYDGSAPLFGGLTRGADGNFYGISYGGGLDNRGRVFKLTPTGALTAVYDFTNDGVVDGGDPAAPLALGRDGNFYGTTRSGGANGTGTVFKLTPSGVLTTLHSFTSDNQEGREVESPLVQGSDGNFYGTAYSGGAFSRGAVFKVTPAGVLTVLHSFSAVDDNHQNYDGIFPRSGLVEGSAGVFYGTTSDAGAEGAGFNTSGLGTFYKITSEGVFTKLHDFTAVTGQEFSAGRPGGTLALGDDGNLYGAATVGGPLGSPAGGTSGTLFKVTPDGGFTVLHRFDLRDGNNINKEGSEPTGLIHGRDGNFYGTCYYGGANRNGTVFKVTPAGGFTVLHTFSALTGDIPTNTDGAAPIDELVEGAKGSFYGVATDGGDHHYGVLYEVTFGPLVTSAPTATATVGKAFSYQITARNNPTSYAATGLPSGLNVNSETGVISGTPTTAGTAKITLKAANAFGVGTAVLTLTIQGAPVITSPGTATATVGKAFSYQIAATNHPTNYAVANQQPGFVLNKTTGLITGKPTGAPGTYTLTLKAANSSGVGTKTLTLTIKPAAPNITSATTATATVGKSFSYQITATGNPTNYAAVSLRPGLHIDTATGLISGTPTGPAGTFAVTLKAANSGGTDEQTLTLTVKSS